MRITDTHVTKGDDGKVTVEFNGEGGEAISVKMAASADLGEGVSIDHARELMVQVATFGIPDEDLEEAQAFAEDDGDENLAVEGVPETFPTTGSFTAPKPVN